jgi:hypothetical protein
VVHARWGTASFSPLCEAAPEPTFIEQWIGRRGKSTGLQNPLSFCLWEHVKALEYSAPINDLEVLQQRVENACKDIRVKPGIFDRVRISEQQAAESCVEMSGNYAEHLLWRSYEHRPYLSRH